jgi:type I restriction enzyme M protein
MLDTDTKRRIDTLRDILVGKLPDPKAQVEQITIALIYKFMNDMDAEAEELGGARKFFAGEFSRYAWPKIMGPGIGAQETLNVYAEAIGKMPENPGIPPLFRDIFKNAFLPYRDPETLKGFLKIIDDFRYDHSEKLGDAFEYLLSVLGSQGDAGQFRTPRHIIDFIVKIVDPKKDETILDPACGTAGFLISSYKHILAANLDGKGQTTLSPDDKARLARGVIGYDISPDMVRLSLVNMYLHGFADPHIDEYDTLTSLDHWSQTADVILANPPFMSPKGGIRPHNRFSIQAKRSEVLFVDYIAEHLSPNGRAGIIVPEGVIFQSQNSYVDLRKMLLESFLVAVVSLPAGVFNPYSGVKTSILILDRALARQSSSVAFFKIENDGFGLGAQRRASGKDDLPRASEELAEYLRRLRARESLDGFAPTLGLVVAKERLAAAGEFNLSGERYRSSDPKSSEFPLISLRDVAEVIAGQSPPGDSYNEAGDGMPFYQGKTEFGDIFIGAPTRWTLNPLRVAEAGDILMSVRAPVGPVNFSTLRICIGRGLAAIKPMTDRVEPMYLFRLLRSLEGEIIGDVGAAFASINRDDIETIQFPLPPLDFQRAVVAEIEGYQKVIDGARAVLDNYRPHIPVRPEWPVAALGELCDQIQYGLSVPLKIDGAGFKTFRMNELVDGRCVDRGDMKRADIPPAEFEKYRLSRGDILFNRTNSFEHVGRTGMFDLAGEYCFASYLIRLTVNAKRADSFFVNATMNTEMFQQGIKQFASRAIGQSNINATNLSAYSISVPPLATQRAIVAEIEAERALVAANRELVERFEKKIQAAIARVWGEASEDAPSLLTAAQ